MSSPIRRMDDDDDQPSDRAPSWLAARRNVPEPERQADIAGPAFSGDRAMVQLNRQLLRTAADLVPEPPLEAGEGGPENHRSMMWRFFSLVGIAAAIAWGIVLLPIMKKPAAVTSQTESWQSSNDASPVQLADAAPTTGGPPPGQNGVPTVDQPRVVALIPITKPPGATAPNDPPSAPRPAPPVAKSVSVVASPPTTSLSQVALTTAAAATTVAANSSAPQSNPVRANSGPAAASPSPQPSSDLTAQAPATASPVPASPQPHAQPAPASPQPVASVTPSTPSEPSATSARSSPASAPNSDEITMLLNRGKDFLASGDLSSAQLLFRRAAEAGSAEAAMNLASTYDPHYLAEHNVVGVMGNEEKARAWYQRAIDLGSAEASRRLAELGNK